MNRRFFFALAIAGFFFLEIESRATIEDVRRLYDLTPVSTNNPVLASVAACDIEIPVSEFRGFINSSFLPDKEGKIMSLSEKRAELEKLLDDYFWIWDGFSHNADKTPDIQGMLAITRDEAMKALLVEQEADAKVTSLEDYEKFKQEIRRELFDKAEIHISSATYEILKSTVKAAGTNEIALSGEAQNVPLATSKAGTVSVGKFLQAYFEIPPTNRPDLAKQENVVGILRDIISEDLLLAAARERGLDQADAVRTQVQADRTGLVREWALDEVTKEAEAKMNEPGIEKQFKQWYRAHRKTLYTKKDQTGKAQVMDFAAAHDLVQDDYFKDLQERMRAQELKKLRHGKKIEINEKLLEQLVIEWPTPARPMKIPPSLVDWSNDMREFVAKAGDTNAVLSFAFTNISPYELVIQDIHAVNEFINIKSPPLPWTLKPGERGEIEADADLRNKKGTGYLPIEVISSFGHKTLTLKLVYFSGAKTN